MDFKFGWTGRERQEDKKEAKKLKILYRKDAQFSENTLIAWPSMPGSYIFSLVQPKETTLERVDFWAGWSELS